MDNLDMEIINKLNEVEVILNKQVEKYEKYLNNDDNWIEFNIDNLKDIDFSLYNEKGGVYYLQIQFNDNFEGLTRKDCIFDKLVNEWKSDKRNKIPNIIKARKSSYDIKPLKNNEWIPFYLGKSNKFGNRIIEHFNKDIECETYGLKLNCITNEFFKNCSYRIKFMQLPHLIDKKYYWSVVNIESKLRSKLNPICGKQ